MRWSSGKYGVEINKHQKSITDILVNAFEEARKPLGNLFLNMSNPRFRAMYGLFFGPDSTALVYYESSKQVQVLTTEEFVRFCRVAYGKECYAEAREVASAGTPEQLILDDLSTNSYCGFTLAGVAREINMDESELEQRLNARKRGVPVPKDTQKSKR